MQQSFLKAAQASDTLYSFGGRGSKSTYFTCDVVIQTGLAAEIGNKAAFTLFQADVAQTVHDLRMKGSVFPLFRATSKF